MSNLKLIISAVVIIAISVLASYFLAPSVTNVIEKITDEPVGGSGGTFQTDWYSFGGVEHVASSMAMRDASTTPCAIQGPSSTSTLLFGSASFVYASTTGATIVHLAKASTAFATTTPIGTTDIASGASGTVIASTTTGILDPPVVFGPSEWFVVGLEGTTDYRTNDVLGTCKAEWIVNRR